MKRNMFKHSYCLIIMVLVLNGCVMDTLQKQQEQHLQSHMELTQKSITVPKQTKVELEQTVPQPPKIQTLNWLATISSLIAKMLKTNGITLGGTLLVDNIKNNTKGSLQSIQATVMLQNILTNNGKLTLVTPQQFATAKQALGLSNEDRLISRNKTIGLARYLGAQYVLYSNAEGDIESPILQMWLVLVQTGEIIWSGSGKVQY